MYFAAAVLLHEEISKVSVWLQKKLSLQLYNNIISSLSLLLIIILSIFLFIKIKGGDRKTSKIFYWCFTVLMATISYNTLMTTNIESIHFPQYAVLALPVFAITMSFLDSIFLIVLLGAIDEAYQYFVFHNWKYLDFNDIVLNLVGAAIGLLIIFTLFNRNRYCEYQGWRLKKSTYFIFTSVFLSIFTFLYLSGLLSFYPVPGDSHAIIILSKVPPGDKFWINFDWGKTCHILTPVEGLSLTAFLISCHAFMDSKIDS
jgi:VanZ family protein